jgi:diguanylate cyclase (GGDEF)-like protein
MIDILYTGLIPVVIVGVTAAVICLIVGARLGDALFFALTAGLLIAWAARIGIILAYHRKHPDGPLGQKDARLWERRYAAGSASFASLLGILGARTLMTNDPWTCLLMTNLIFGYGSGLVARSSVRPALCLTSFMLATGPSFVVTGLKITGSDHTMSMIYLAEMLILTTANLAAFEITSYGYKSVLLQLLTKRDLAMLAEQDALTGLPNRLQLRTKFGLAALRAKDTNESVAIHCLDLDRFKAVNDIYGHPTGDALLRAVSERLLGTLRDGDIAARLGGDEFVIMQANIHRACDKIELAERVIHVIGAPYNIEGHEIDIGVSVGIALYPRDGQDLDQIIAHADAALYLAKRERSGRPVVWNKQQASASAAKAA